VAAGHRGRKRGLFTKPRTGLLRLDETLSCEPPPLSRCSCRGGDHAGVPSTGNHARRVRPGALNLSTGTVLLLITEVWNEQTHQYFLQMLRRHWGGRHLVLFEDRGTPHTTDDSREVAAELGSEIRLLPRATPELNAREHLWRQGKGRAWAARPPLSIDQSADAACRSILERSPGERLQKAGVFSGNFWLTT
jgi:transposase